MQKVFRVQSKNIECGGSRRTCVMILEVFFINNIASAENKEHIYY